MFFKLVHEVGNRQRWVTNGTMTTASAERIADDVLGIIGVSGVRVNPRTGSVIVFTTMPVACRLWPSISRVWQSCRRFFATPARFTLIPPKRRRPSRERHCQCRLLLGRRLYLRLCKRCAQCLCFVFYRVRCIDSTRFSESLSRENLIFLHWFVGWWCVPLCRLWSTQSMRCSARFLS